MISPSVNIDPLKQSAQFVKGVGPVRFEKLQRLGIETVRDLLYHFPRAYEDLTDVRPIASLNSGKIQTVHGEVVEIDGKQLLDGRCVVTVVISDGKDVLEGAWFNQKYISSKFRYGQRVAFSGKPKWYKDHWQMGNPRVQYLDPNTEQPDAGILPVYPLTEDLRAEHLRPIMQEALDKFSEHIQEILPEELRRVRKLPEARQALYDAHFPSSMAVARAAQRRFLYEGFILLQLALAVRRREVRGRKQAPVLKTTPQIDARIRRLYPFPLTKDQNKAVHEICRDMASETPMQRLLQADVGAGKTAVAVYALLVAIANKHQALFMAPTEVLAQQHWQTLETYLAQSRVRRAVLTGGLSAKQRRETLAGLASGEIDLVVGTQALIQDAVQFTRLGLVVIDEQHRFGVHQRARVRKLGVDPHYLVMTATPIPRTISLTVFGDLDTSIIRELPPGRQPVVTRWLPAKQRDQVYRQVREGLLAGRQAYVVCPLAVESETVDVKNAEQLHAELAQGPFKEFHLGLLHGRLGEDVKKDVMDRFRNRKLDLLVSTTVIEVGVDVPNATFMVIEHADRFGLSQLHQLRGRVSRGETAGQCLLFADAVTDETKKRLQILTRTTDGFALAEEDARLRGVGEFFGYRQHGLGELDMEKVLANRDLLQMAREDAFGLVKEDARLSTPEHGLLRTKIIEKYGQTLQLSEIG